MEDEFKHLVRISRKDVNGNKTIEQALTEIKGVGISLSKTMCRTLDLDLESKIGYIADEDVLRIEEILENPQKFDIPSWMLNRREDYEVGLPVRGQRTKSTFRKSSSVGVKRSRG